MQIQEELEALSSVSTSKVAAYAPDEDDQASLDGQTGRIEALFHKIDTDQSGTLERSEITSVHQDGKWATLFDKLDANGDGMVSMLEWKGLFQVVLIDLGKDKLRFFLEYLEGDMATRKVKLVTDVDASNDVEIFEDTLS